MNGKIKIGALVKHPEYGKGVVRYRCKDSKYVQVDFEHPGKLPRPIRYQNSMNPFAVFIGDLEVIHYGNGVAVLPQVEDVRE